MLRERAAAFTSDGDRNFSCCAGLCARVALLRRQDEHLTRNPIRLDAAPANFAVAAQRKGASRAPAISPSVASCASFTASTGGSVGTRSFNAERISTRL